MKTSILVIDDDKGFIEDLKLLLPKNFVLYSSSDPEIGLEILGNEEIEVVLLDIELAPDKSGIEYIGKIKNKYPYIPIIMVSYHKSPDVVVKSLHKGAVDYIHKLIPYENLINKIKESVIKYRVGKNRQEDKQLIYHSNEMKKIIYEINKIAKTDFTICLTGESGVGKSAIAKYIHQNSERSNNNFVRINIPSIPESLFESELFGHTKGAFTGADKDKIGRIEFAEGGTVFLDEISETNLHMQAKLLRLLEDKEYEMLGDFKTKKANIRIITATNKNLHELIVKNEFRKDLFYRISTITINIPPLRERKEDIPELLDYYSIRIGEKVLGKKIIISKSARELLINYDWPGNVRELINLMERLTIKCFDKSQINETDILEHITISKINHVKPFSEYEKEQLLKLRFEYFYSLLKKNKWNLSRTAREAGISRQNLYRIIDHLGLKEIQNC